MGESFLGLPNRFKVINNLLETTYNPNHILSAYQGNVLATEYMNRIGGTDYSMKGPLYTQSILPYNSKSYDLGSTYLWFNNLYVDNIVTNTVKGVSTSTEKFSSEKTISLTGSVVGSITTDFDGDVTIDTTTNHNHDALYLKLTGGTLTGTLHSKSVIPSEDSLYNLGSLTQKYKSIYTNDLYATSIEGSLTGNATSADKLSSVRTMTIKLRPSINGTNYDTASIAFDGSKDISMTVPASYLPITGGILRGSLDVSGNILPTSDTYSLGNEDNYWKDLYVENTYGSLIGNADSATKLKTERKITVSLIDSTDINSNYGSGMFDGTGDLNLMVNAPYLSISGGTIDGDVLPKSTNSFYLGSSSFNFKGIYANQLYGNSSSASKLETVRNIKVGNTSRSFDGSGDISWSLVDIGAADRSVVGTTTEFKTFQYTYSSGNTQELGDISSISYSGDSNVAITLEAGTYIIVSRISGTMMPRSVTIGIALGLGSSATWLERSYVTIPSCPVIVDDNGVVKARNNAFDHKVQSTSIQTFSSRTTVTPCFEMVPSPNWGGNTFYYNLSIQAIRIK